VVFGLGIATALTLIFTPSLLALRIWASTYVFWVARAAAALSSGRRSAAARDWALNRAAKKTKAPELLWDQSFDDDYDYVEEEAAPEPEINDLRRVLADRKAALEEIVQPSCAPSASDSKDDHPKDEDDKPVRAAE
jgi:multidrug efflux pump